MKRTTETCDNGLGGSLMPTRRITFHDKLTAEEREAARLYAICDFCTLGWIADIMNEEDCSFSEAEKIFYQRKKEMK